MTFNNPMIDTERKNTSGSDEASPAIYGIKVFWAKSGESEICGFSGLHLLYHWERAPKMVQEVGLGSGSPKGSTVQHTTTVVTVSSITLTILQPVLLLLNYSRLLHPLLQVTTILPPAKQSLVSGAWLLSASSARLSAR